MISRDDEDDGEDGSDVDVTVWHLTPTLVLRKDDDGEKAPTVLVLAAKYSDVVMSVAPLILLDWIGMECDEMF